MKFQTILLTLCLLLCTFINTNAQIDKDWMFGAEFDIVPYLFNGYYLSAVGGYGHFRARIALTEITVPSFLTDSKFEDNNLRVKALIVDYYFKKGFFGWWIGSGYEIWKGEISEKSSKQRKEYNTDILTVGGGYTYRFSDYFYIIPWAGIHFPVGGDKKIEFQQSTFEIKTMPEASIKIGINF